MSDAPKFEVCEEMQKLREYLTEHGIFWYDDSTKPMEGTIPVWICRTKFFINGYHWSVINGFGSYGGFTSFLMKNKGQLEAMSNALYDGNPVGWLTAEDVIKEIEKWM